MAINMKRYELLLYWIIERHSIYLKRQKGLQPPWTSDKILQTYRFCNVYRELDTVTQWIANNWRNPNTDNPHVWFAMLISRFINHPASMSEIGFPVPYDRDKILTILQSRQSRKEVVFNNAYMITTATLPGNKLDVLATHIWDVLWRDREKVKPTKNDTLESFFNRLIKYYRIGNFLTGQIIADTKFTNTLNHASDFLTWAIAGPGSLRGMRRILGLSINQKSEDKFWYSNLLILLKMVNNDIPKYMPAISAQDLQNCLCEYDKYMRTLLNEGKPKQLYKTKSYVC